MANQPINYRYYLTTRRYLVLTGAAALVAVVIALVGIFPQVQASLTAWGQLQKENQAVATLQKKADELSKVQSSIAFAKADIVNQVLPAKKPLLELLTAISDAAQTTSVQTTEISLSPGSIATDSASLVAQAAAPSRTTKSGQRAKTVSKKAYDSIDVNMKVLGTLAQINQFFTLVERTAPTSILTSISLNKFNTGRESAPASPDLQRFEAEITVTTYYYTQSVTAALETPLPPITAVEEKVLAELDNFTFPTVEAQPQVRGGGLENLFGPLQTLPTLRGSSALPTLQSSPAPAQQSSLGSELEATFVQSAGAAEPPSEPTVSPLAEPVEPGTAI